PRRAGAARTVSLWDGLGNRLARVPSTPGGSGWREVRLPRPVTLRAGQPYTVSYHAPDGVYALVPGYFREHAPRTASLRVAARSGSYAYGRSAFPRRHNPAGHN